MTTPSNSACCGGAAYPRQWKLYVSNNGDGECTDCELFDGEYVVNLQGGIECAHFDGSTGAFCNWSEAWLHFYVSAYGDGTYEFQLELQAPEHEPDQWVCWKTDQPVDAAKRWALGTLIEDNDYCNWGSATIEAEPVDIEFPVTPDDVYCLCNMRKGAPKCWPCEPALHMGPTAGCGCKPTGSPAIYSLNDCCACESGCPCQSSEHACVSCKDRPAAAPRLGHPFLDRAMDLVSRLRYSLEGRPEWWPPAPLVNPSNGNVVLQIWPPLGGPADPRVVLTYNSWSPEESEYGYGWSNSLNRWVAGGNIVHAGDGAIFYYESANYTPPAGAQNTLVCHEDYSGVETQPDGFQMHYETTGKLTKFESAAGDVWTLVGFGGDRVYAVIDPFNRRTSIVYGGSDKIQRVVDAYGRITTFTVDGSGDLVKMTTPELCETEFRYDANHQLTAYIDPEGSRTTFSYEGVNHWVQSIQTPDGQRVTYLWDEWRKTRIIDPSGNTTRLTYNWYRNITEIGDALGQVTTYAWFADRPQAYLGRKGARTTVLHAATDNGLKQLHEIQYPDGGRFSFAYDANSRLSSVTDQLGYRATLVWDASGNREAVIDPLGYRTSYVYNAWGQITAVVDALGNRSTTLYDSLGQMSAQVDPLGYRTTYAYQYGQLRAVENPLGAITTYQRDAMNRLAAEINPLGYRTSFAYDLGCRLTATTNPLGARFTTLYDWLGRIEATLDPLGNRTTYSYDERGNRISAEDPLGKRTTTLYDTTNRRIAEINPLGYRTSFAYDLDGNLASTENPLGERVTSLYDSVGRVVATVNPLGYRSSFSYDLAGNQIASTNPLGRIATTVYDQASQMVALVDPLANRTTTVYDPVGRSVAAIDALANRGTSVYDAAGQMVAAIDPLGNRRTTIYDSAGGVAASMDPLGCRTSFSYNLAGNQTASTNPLGQIATSVYDAASRAVAAINPLGNRSTSAYDLAGQAVVLIDAKGNRRTTIYDASGQTAAVVDPLGNRSTSVYDDAGQLVATIDPLGNRDSALYDAAGRTQAAIDALGYRTTFTYDSAGQQIAVKDAREQIWTTLYDTAGRIQAMLDALENRTTYGHDAAGRQTTVTDARGNISTTVYSAAGQAISSIDPLGNRWSFSYDAAGRSVAQASPLGALATTVYDNAGQTIAVVKPLGSRTTFSFDAAGRPIAAADPNGHISTTVFDAAGQPLAQVDALGCRTTTVHDEVGRAIVLIDPNGGRNTYSYDSAGRIVQHLDALGRATTFGYDSAGRQTSILDARSVRATFQYNAIGRNIVRVSSNDPPVTFTYDAVGNAAEIQDGTGRSTFTYDSLNRRLTAKDPAGNAITYSYDAVGARAEMIAPGGGRFTYAYTALGAIDHLTNPQGDRTSYSYDADGRRTTKELANGSRASYSYDLASQVAEVYNFKSDARVIVGFAYDYDPAGNRTGVLESGGDRVTWTCDAANRLTREERSGALAYDMAYTYDPLGNRLVKDSSGARTTSTYDLASQLRTSQDSSGVSTYTYDLAGNLTAVQEPSGERTTRVWDDQNRQTSVLSPGGAITTCAYRFDGLRASKEDSAGTKKHLWDFSNYLGETDEDNELQAVYTNEPEEYGNLISQYRRGPTIWVPSYYHCDALGSTRALTDESGDATDTYLQDAWGNQVSVSGSTANPFRWVGQVGYYYDDLLATFYIRARVYDPTTGRWLSQDPLFYPAAGQLALPGAPDPAAGYHRHRYYHALLGSFAGRDPLKGDENEYRYALNVPLGFVDPAGEDFIPLGRPETLLDLDTIIPWPKPDAIDYLLESVSDTKPSCKSRIMWSYGLDCPCCGCNDTQWGTSFSPALLDAVVRNYRFPPGITVKFVEPSDGFSLTCPAMRRTSSGTERHLFLFVTNKSICDALAMLTHEAVHAEQFKHWLRTGHKPSNRDAMERVAYSAQCKDLARQNCITQKDSWRWVTECRRKLFPASVYGPGVYQISRGCAERVSEQEGGWTVV